MDAIVLMSGGIDSTACAHLLKDKGFKVSALFLDYGQVARKPEYDAVKHICDYMNIPLTKEKIFTKANFKEGEIIGRNAFFIFSALMMGHANKGLLAIGVHSGTPYYDCSQPFLKKISDLVSEYTGGKIELIAPFSDWTKNDIILYSKNQDIPLEKTYSCEKGEIPPCKVCVSCTDRENV